MLGDAASLPKYQFVATAELLELRVPRVAFFSGGPGSMSTSDGTVKPYAGSKLNEESKPLPMLLRDPEREVRVS